MAENNSGGWMAQAAPLLATAANTIGKGGPKRQYRYNKKMTDYQNRLNRENAEWAFNKELELRRFQMDYDSPQAQMQRYKDAGLNPNLIYGSGSAAAGSFEPPSAPNVPGVTAHSVDAAVLGNIGTEFQQARLMAAQTDFTRTRTDKTLYDRELTRAQTEVVKANPYLQKGYVESLVTQMRATADMKAQERDWHLEGTQRVVNGQLDNEGPARGYVKMEQTLRNLEQKFNLDKLDEKIKAQVIQSKEFRNEIDKIQVEWLKDGDITPQHIYQGIMMVLQQLMRRL